MDMQLERLPTATKTHSDLTRNESATFDHVDDSIVNTNVAIAQIRARVNVTF